MGDREQAGAPIVEKVTLRLAEVLGNSSATCREKT